MTKTKQKENDKINKIKDGKENEYYYKLIMKMDKIFEKEFGKMCPEFESACVQCRAHLIYNNFKKELYELL